MGFFKRTLLAIAVASSLKAGTGTVRYFQMSGPNWDQFTTSTATGMRSFIREHVSGIATFGPFFDDKLAWMPHAWLYYDSYAIYANSPVAAAHPEWILKDASGNKLFIPFQCAAGTCPQYAGDISNLQFRSYQITTLLTMLKAGGATESGYEGAWLDDVNMNMFVGDGTGKLVVPMDARTGQPMSANYWNMYFAQFLELIRASLPPSVKIAHNSLWFVPQDQYVRRQIGTADLINVERGFGDEGLTGGTGQWSLAAMFNYIDFLHSVGAAAEIDDYFLSDRMYSLACYFLVQNGADVFGISEQTPGNWPSTLYSINLGPATGPRYKWLGVWRRDFMRGFVLVNEPGAAAVTMTLPDGMVDTDGAPVASVTMAGKQGAIFLLASQ